MSATRPSLSRRSFLRAISTAAAATPLATLPRRSPAAASPSNRIRVAGIGVGGMGAGDVGAVGSDPNVEIVALCDVDLRRSAETFKKFPQARQFRDFRRMFDAMEKDIDAVIVATPDHTHAVAAMAAIQRGKHVYCEKPLAHSVHEVRALMKAASEHKVVTQLGNQGHSYDSIRDFCEWIWAGAIGKAHTIHAGCDALNSGVDQLAELSRQHPVPETLDWDLWLGPAQERPYHPAFVPGRWRSWVPFGNGTVGDWACHVLDPVFWALDLGLPSTIQAKVDNYDPKTQGLTFPKGEVITYEFPARGDRGPITLKWHSGTERIPRPEELDREEGDIRTGAVVIGDKGKIVYGSHGAGGVRLIPSSRMDDFQRPAKTIPRVKGHHWDWLDAIRNGRKAGSDFSYGGPLTEIAMLGVIAIKFPGQKLEWDAANARFTNFSEANAWVNPPYREGWSLESRAG
jgi:predicted dehydrogenase